MSAIKAKYPILFLDGFYLPKDGYLALEPSIGSLASFKYQIQECTEKMLR